MTKMSNDILGAHKCHKMVSNLDVTQHILLSHYTKPVAKGNGNNPLYCCRHALFPVFEFVAIFKKTIQSSPIGLFPHLSDGFFSNEKQIMSVDIKILMLEW